MKALIVTVAGLSSRFSKSVGKETLKCIYYKNDPTECLLYRLLHLDSSFDSIIIVGGYKQDELAPAVTELFPDLAEKISLVFNPHFSDFGSGFSLKVGLEKAMELGADEIVFAEGDLFLDKYSFRKICTSSRSVLTSSPEDILASKAVAYYFDVNYHVHYIYDTAHSALEINEPFLAIYNSGQVWKFTGRERIQTAFDNVPEKDWEGTNLVYISSYFGGLSKDDYEVIRFSTWINCNTVEDFDLALQKTDQTMYVLDSMGNAYKMGAPIQQ